MWARYRGITARENGTFGGPSSVVVGQSYRNRRVERRPFWLHLASHYSVAWMSVASRGLLMSWPLTGLKAEMSLSAVFLGVHDCMRIKGQHVSSSPVLLFVLFSVFSEELS